MAGDAPRLKWFARIVFVVLAFVVLLAVGLRIFSLFPSDTPFYVSDPNVGFRVRPNVSMAGNRTNSSGFNDIEHEKGEKKKTAIRTVVIGDSFVFGAVPRKENFVALMEELSRNEARNVEVWNMGIPAAGPENYLPLIKQDAVSAKADVVCLVFFVGNDITQSHPDFKTKIFFGTPREILRTPYVVRFSEEYFYVYRLFRASGRLLWNYLAKSSQGGNGTFPRETYLSIEYQRSTIYRIKEGSRIIESYSGAKSILKRMAMEAAKNNMRFMVVLAPDELQVNPRLRNEFMQRYGLNPGEYDLAQPQKLLMEYLKSEAIEAIDLLPDFLQAGKIGTLYLRNDSHWNEEGNRLAAQKIWAHLSEVLSRD
jgi:hypothetical protein